MQKKYPESKSRAISDFKSIVHGILQCSSIQFTSLQHNTFPHSSKLSSRESALIQSSGICISSPKSDLCFRDATKTAPRWAVGDKGKLLVSSAGNFISGSEKLLMRDKTNSSIIIIGRNKCISSFERQR